MSRRVLPGAQGHTLGFMLEPTTIEVRGGTDLIVSWPDGRVDALPAVLLRDACACAGCRTTPPPPADPETCRISSIGFVGAYAVNMVFAPDAHGAGIYSFSMLRDLGDDQKGHGSSGSQ